MKLLINTASTYKGGGVQVAKSFIEELRSIPDHEYHIVLGQTIAGLVNSKTFPSNFHFYFIPYRPATRVFSINGPAEFFKNLEEKIKPDCVFTTSGPSYWRPKAPHLMGYNLPHYIYPDSPFFKKLSLYKQLYWKAKGLLIQHFTKADADTYVVQTDDVNKRLRKLIGKTDVFTVTNTHGAHFLNGQNHRKTKLPDRRQGEFRLLFLSAWYKHKNFEIINSIAERFSVDQTTSIRFVLTLPTDVFDSLFTPAAKQVIINVGTVKPDECPDLYHECDAVFLPTLLECFSANYAEGMVMKKPIVTSDLGFAHTVCGDAALYIQPLDGKDIANKIDQLRHSPELRAKLVNAGSLKLKELLTSRQRADAYLQLCEKIAAK